MKTILLVDEDQELRTTLRGWLTEAGWHVYEAENGAKGWEVIQQKHPQVVICDLLMPRCNGFRLCHLVRGNESLKNIRIIISSGRGYPADRANAIEAGADEYLVKPVEQYKFLYLLNQILEPGWQRKVAAAPPIPPDAPKEPILVHTEGLKIKFWGVRGSIPTPGPSTVHYGGNTTCVEVRADGEIMILDAGSGIRPLGLSLVQEFKGQPIRVTLMLSHTHWDHIQGFPFFIPAYNPKNQIRICGYEGAQAGLQGILSSQMESPYFPVSLRQMPGNIVFDELHDMKFNVGKVQAEAAFTNHPGICVGYRLNTSFGSVAFLPDNEPYQRLRGATTQSGAEIAYARKMDEKLINFIRDVEVLIIDSQYDDTEYQRHIGWGHGCLDDVVSLALIAGVKRLYLFHHDPGHDDAHVTRMVEWARNLVAMHGDPLIIEAAREGDQIIIGLPEPESSPESQSISAQ